MYDHQSRFGCITGLAIVMLGLCLSGIVLAKTASASKPNPKDAARLKTLLSHLETAQGEFTQAVYDSEDPTSTDTSEHDMLSNSHGKWYLKKPGKFRWEVIAKDRLLIVANGQKIWHYDPDLAQVVIEHFDPKGTSPLLFLTSTPEHIEKRFRIDSGIGKHSICSRYESDCFELTPLKPEGTFQWIRMGFKQEQLDTIEFVDQWGQRGLIELKNVKINQPISDKLFTFTPPKGVDVVTRGRAQ